MNKPQPDHDPAIQHFHQWVKRSRAMGSGDAQVNCNRPFLPYLELENYFGDQYRVQKLLRALFRDRAESPVGPDEIRENYSKVFFILLLIGKGCYIGHVVHHDDLRDQHLPFKTLPDSFPIAPTDPDFFDSFYQKQWEFCAPIFHDNMNKIFGDREVLPITHKERLRTGGSATTFKIILHPYYNHLTPKRNTEEVHEISYSLTQAFADVEKNINEQHANTYVLKTYETKEAEKYYNNEVSAFRELRREGHNPDIIGYHGSFTQKGTYNVILEYADKGTLEDYFRTTTPPSRGEEIIKFWRGIFRILNALSIIHNVPRNSAEGPQFLQGWHQDVKPANILIKSSQSGSAFDCLFKLADLGLSHFTRTISPKLDATGKDTHGTQAYGAPECYRVNDLVDRQPMQVTPSVDIYSLGCVFSEAAIWVVRGWDGLLEYRRRRRMETQKIANFRVNDCFHDGNTTFDMVHEMHNNLIQDCGRSDHVTEPALGMVKDMLEVDDGRPSARALYIKSERILAAAEKELERSAGWRFSGGMNVVRNSQSKLDDRPRTPPQVPNGYHQFHSRHSQGYGTIPTEIPSDLESTAYPKAGNGHPVYNFDPPASPGWKSSKRSPPFGRHEDFILMEPQTYDQAASDDDDERSASPSSPVSSKNRYASRNTSRIHRRNMFNPRKGQNNDRAGTFPAASPVTDPGMLDRDLAFPNMNSRQDQVPAASAALSTVDARSTTQRAQSGQRKDRTSPPIAAQTEAARTPLMENFEKPSAMPSPAPKPPPPTLSVAVAQRWKNDKKSGIKTFLPDGYLINNLNRRDHVFLIDDSLSMKRHREEVRALVGLLAYMVKDSDPDGIELLFTISGREHRSKKGKSRELTNILQHKHYEGNSNIRLSLHTIVQNYKERLKEPVKPASSWWSFKGRSAEPVRGQNVYVFTDGTWQPDCDPTEIIADLVGNLKEHKVLKEQFGIQFISFGNDPGGLATLERLDQGLNLPLDIIDTEPSNGNVWKMLLGAVNKWLDDAVSDSGSPPRPDVIATNGASSHGQRVYP